MRYTTIIDITELPLIYRNVNARLVYMHCCLKCGYHDGDRDIYRTSLRRLSYEVGITLGAVRHAVRQLAAAGLLTMNGGVVTVKKYVMTEQPTPRARTKKEAAERAIVEQRAAEAEARQKEMQQEQRKRAAIEKTGKTPYMLYYESQVARAAAGDAEAAEVVRSGKKTYESHAAAIAARQKGGAA